MILFLGQPFVSSAQNIRVLYEAGWQAYEQGQYPEARKIFGQVIDLYENFAPAYYALGKVCYDESGGPEERQQCLWYFERAVGIEPKYANAYEGICRIQHELGETDLAEQTCLKALSLDPNLHSTKLLLAWIYLLGKGDPDRALQYFDAVLKVTSNPIIIFGRGMAFAEKGDNAQVVEIITQLRSAGSQEFANHLEMVLRSKVSPDKLVPMPLLMNMAASQMEQQQAAEGAPAAGEGAAPVQGSLPGTMQVQIHGQIPVIVPQIQSIQGIAQPQQPVRGGQSVDQHPGGLTQE